ncbi:MAG: MBL fold metallo-hydrolase RNA specificity domain-containing protein [Pseudomonadota bacterium]
MLIPAFAVERTQEILYLLGEFYRKGSLPPIPIYLDSPLAIKATQIFRKNKRYYDQEAMGIVEQGFDPFDMPNLQFTESAEESKAINEGSGSAIVIAGNGMCTAGRIKHHLKHNLWRPGASLVIVGFQAQGTTGRKIIEGQKWVKIFGEKVAVKARLFTIGGLSAHADQNDLMEWVSHFESHPKTFIVHGEATASKVLGQKIQERFNLEGHVPKWKERLILKPKEVTYEQPSEEAPLMDMETTTLNAVIDLEKELDRLKKRIKRRKEQEITEDEVDRLKYIQEELEEILSG